MKDLRLPDFDIPDLRDKALDPRAIEEWRVENLRHLKESGQLAAIRNQASRRPSPVRFTLSDREVEQTVS